MLSSYICFFLILFPTFYAFASPTLPKAPYITPQTAKEWIQNKRPFTFVDVRAAKEYKAGHLPGAFNIRFDQVEKKTKLFKKDRDYVFYCTYSAWRAPYAANSLADLGYTNVYVLEGGASAWNAGGQVIYATNVNEQAAIIPYEPGSERYLRHPRDRVYKEKVNLTRKELKNYNGQDGHPAYVAVDGVIYDLTESRLWRGGEHAPSKHQAFAGNDLTELLKDSPHGKKPLEMFPIVGKLVD